MSSYETISCTFLLVFTVIIISPHNVWEHSKHTQSVRRNRRRQFIQFKCDTYADSDYKRTNTHYEIEPESDTNVEVSKNPPENK